MQNEKEEEEISVQVGIPETVYQQDKAHIDMQIATAKTYPRNIRRSLENAIAIVSMDLETAKTCTYAVPRGNKTISGPSVHLAKILAQVWGNMRIEAKVINIDGTHVTSQAIAFDLENNLAIKVEVKRSIMGRQGRYNDDMITVTGNAGNSIALRNAVLSVIPRAIVDKVYNSAKNTMTGDISDKNKFLVKRKQVLDSLKDLYAVTEKEVLNVIGRSAVDYITADDLVVIIGIGQAIKDGDTTADEAFRSDKIKPLESKLDQDLLDTWKQQLDQCKSIQEVQKLRKSNKPTHPDILKLFADREKSLQ